MLYSNATYMSFELHFHIKTANTQMAVFKALIFKQIISKLRLRRQLPISSSFPPLRPWPLFP
jgi:hypothetical protein